MKIVSEKEGLAIVFESEQDFKHHVQNLIGFKNSIEYSGAKAPYVYYLYNKEGIEEEDAEDKIETIRNMFKEE